MSAAGGTARVGAIILAGGSVPPSLVDQCAHRALLRVGGRYALAYLVETLATTPGVAAQVLVAPDAALTMLAQLPIRRAPAGGSIVANMRLGADALADTDLTHLLFVTGDLPLVTPEGLGAYLRDSLASGAALTYPIIPRSAAEARFPGARRTYVRIHEGTFTGGNAILTTRNLLDDKGALIEALYGARKNPLALARLLGWQTVLRMLTGTLALPYLEGIATRILDAPVRAIISTHAELGFDVDKLEDLQVVEAALAATR